MDGARGGLNFVSNDRFSNGLIGDGDEDSSLFAIGVDTRGAVHRLDQGTIAEARATDERSQHARFFAVRMDGAGGLKVSPAHEVVVLPISVGVNQDPRFFALGG